MSSTPSPLVSPDTNAGGQRASAADTFVSGTLPLLVAVTVYVTRSPAAATEGTDAVLVTSTRGCSTLTDAVAVAVADLVELPIVTSPLAVTVLVVSTEIGAVQVYTHCSPVFSS